MLLFTSMLGIAGGYYAMRRKHFKRALTGGMAALAAISITFFWIGAEQRPAYTDDFWRQVYIAIPVMGVSVVGITAAVLTGKKSVFIPLTAFLILANIGMDYYFFFAGIREKLNNPPMGFYPIMLAGLGGMVPVILLILSRREFE